MIIRTSILERIDPVSSTHTFVLVASMYNNSDNIFECDRCDLVNPTRLCCTLADGDQIARNCICSNHYYTYVKL